MNSLQIRRRFRAIVSGSANSLFLPLAGAAFSLLVIRFTSLALWGDFVGIMLYVNAANHLVYWGNRDYLLRGFSERPGKIALLWRRNLLSRLPLLLCMMGMALFTPLAFPEILLVQLWLFAAFASQAGESLVVYRRRFAISLLLDVFVLTTMLAAALWLREQLTVAWLLGIFAGTGILKAAGLLLLLRRDIFSGAVWQLRLSELRASLPFLLLGLSGMLQSRSDLFCVDALLGAAVVGRYQILVSLLTWVQMLAALLLQPFLKNLFRLPDAALMRLSLRLLLPGTLITLAAVCCLFLLLPGLYGISLSNWQVLWSGLLILPVYFYLPLIYRLYRDRQTTRVVWINVSGIAGNLALTLWWIPHYGITGALAGSAAAQWLIALTCFFGASGLVKDKR